MPRITCRQPSTGKPINVRQENVSLSWVIIAEAPDFSVPDPSGSQYTVRDPADANRGIAPGEIFFLTPLVVKNKTNLTTWIELRFVTEEGAADGGLSTEGAINDAYGRFYIPAGESISIPIQGRSLVKRNVATTRGDTLRVRAGVTAAFDVWASANEQTSAEHVGVD